MNILKKRHGIFAMALAVMLTGCTAVSAATVPETQPEIRTAVRYMDTLPDDWSAGAKLTEETEYLRSLTATAFYTLENGALSAGLAAMPEDVTGEYAGSYGIPDGARRGYAFRIALDDRVRWEDGTAVTADDVLLTLSAQLADYLWIANAEGYLEGRERETDEVISLRDAGFATAAAAREAGYTRFYVDAANLWGLEAGWESITDRTRLRDYAMPDGLNELYVTPAYLYRDYLAEGKALEYLQSAFLGVTRNRADVLTEADVGILKTGEHELLLITQEPATALTVASRLAALYLPRETGGSYGPYRVAASGEEQLVLERNAYWQCDTAPYPADVILCKPR